MHGSKEYIKLNPPIIILEVYDLDICVSGSFFSLFFRHLAYIRGDQIFIYRCNLSTNLKRVTKLVSRGRNSQGIKEFCGRCTAIPLVKLAEETYSPPDFPPKLGWYKFKSQRDFSGSVLAAFELIEVRDATLDRYSHRARETEAIRANQPSCHPFCVDSFFSSSNLFITLQ